METEMKLFELCKETSNAGIPSCYSRGLQEPRLIKTSSRSRKRRIWPHLPPLRPHPLPPPRLHRMSPSRRRFPPRPGRRPPPSLPRWLLSSSPFCAKNCRGKGTKTRLQRDDNDIKSLNAFLQSFIGDVERKGSAQKKKLRRAIRLQ